MSNPRVTELLRIAGLTDFSMVRQDVLQRAQEFGKAVHKACELWDKGVLNTDTLPEPLIPYLEGWKQFVKNYDLDFEPEGIEKRLVSERYGFGGTPDRFKGKILVDIKTSTQMYASTAIQTAGYQILVEENMGIKIKKRLGVQLTEKGYKVEPYTDSSDKSVFLSTLNLYNWKKRKGLIK